jgi:hypothetical protein
MAMLLGSITEGEKLCYRIRHWNQVGLRAKADFAYGPAGKRPVAPSGDITVEATNIRNPAFPPGGDMVIFARASDVRNL